MRPAGWLALAVLAGSCGPADTGATGGAADEAASSEAASRADLARGPVVANALEALGEVEPAEATAEIDPDLALRLDALLDVLSKPAEASTRRIALEDFRQLGPAVTPTLAATLLDRAAAPELRTAAAQALAACDTRAAAEVLLAFVEASRGNEDPEPWLVAQCAWRLGETTQDWIVPRLVLCMRYETDHESVLWIVDTLARFGNYCGLQTLSVIADTSTPELAARAIGMRDEHAREAGFERAADLYHAWTTGEGLPEPEASAARDREVWRTILALSEWQLRGVDDGRFVLSRLGPRAASFLAQALRDENLYIRVHSAQCLERMGPRAAPALDALLAALKDPALAPQAALALGAQRSPRACDALVARLDARHPLELRVAATRALGLLDCAGADAPLLALLEADEPIDLRAAAAGSLASTGPLAEVRPAVRLLADLLTSNEVEASVVEANLEVWMQRGGPERVSDETRAAWAAVSDLAHAQRRARRAEIVRAELD